MSPKQLRIAQQKAEQERLRQEAIAAGKKPADPTPTANLTPLVEFRELEIDLKAIPDWKADPSLQCPPGGRRLWSVAHGPNVNFEFEYVSVTVCVCLFVCVYYAATDVHLATTRTGARSTSCNWLVCCVNIAERVYLIPKPSAWLRAFPNRSSSFFFDAYSGSMR